MAAAGQQQAALHAFLNQPAAAPTPGQAAPTQVLPPLPGQKGNARQKAAQKAVEDEQRKEQKAMQEQADLRAKMNQQATSIATDTITERLQSVGDRAQALGQSVESWSERVATPGGIGLLLLAIFFLLWAVVPVNGGKTRLELLWLTLTGRTKMSASPDAGGTFDPSATTSGTGSGGPAPSNVTDVTDLLSSLPIRDWTQA